MELFAEAAKQGGSELPLYGLQDNADAVTIEGSGTGDSEKGSSYLAALCTHCSYHQTNTIFISDLRSACYVILGSFRAQAYPTVPAIQGIVALCSENIRGLTR